MEKRTKEKICAFYASDYHFEMISLPFIEKNLEDNKEIIILTENNLEETIKVLISKINLNKEKKNNIANINWKNDDLNKFKKIKNNMEDKKDTIILVKGKENYIRNINENIEKWTNKCNFMKVIDCYDISEVQGKLSFVMSKYNNILNTSGIRKIENL